MSVGLVVVAVREGGGGLLREEGLYGAVVGRVVDVVAMMSLVVRAGSVVVILVAYRLSFMK